MGSGLHDTTGRSAMVPAQEVAVDVLGDVFDTSKAASPDTLLSGGGLIDWTAAIDGTLYDSALVSCGDGGASSDPVGRVKDDALSASTARSSGRAMHWG
jgi:hypothetical protein